MESEGREDGVVAGGGATVRSITTYRSTRSNRSNRVGGVAKRRWLSRPTTILDRLNDPEVTELTVRFLTDDSNFGEFDGDAVDWSRKENFDAIALNTHLEDLEISGNVRLLSKGVREHQNITSFYRAIAANRCMESLFINECVIDPGEALSILGPFFEHNTNLRGFHIDVMGEENRESPSPEGFPNLLSALSRCNKSTLRYVSIDFDGLTDGQASTLVDNLATYDNLEDLTLKFEEDFWSTSPNKLYASLGKLLSKTLLESLELPFFKRIDERGASFMAQGLAECKSLWELDLSYSRLSTSGWGTLLQGLLNSSLKVLHLRQINIGDDALVALGNALATLESLSHLELDHLGVGHEEEEGVILISSQGWRDFFAAIANSCEGLEEICLVGNTIDDSVAYSLVNALASKKRLRCLNLGQSRDMTAWGWSEIANILCNKRSAESILDSNHNIVEITDDSGDLETMLQMNRNENKVEVARRKILLYHFSDGDCNMEEFVDLDASLLPSAMAWMGRDHHGLSVLFRFAKAMPTLFATGKDPTTRARGAERRNPERTSRKRVRKMANEAKQVG